MQLFPLNLWPLFLFFLATFSFSQTIELFHSVNSIIHTFTASSLYLPTTLFSFITSRLPLLFFTHGLNALPHLYLRPDLFDLWLYAFSFPVYSSFSPGRLHNCRLENRRTHITFLCCNVSIPRSHYVKVMFAATLPPMITPSDSAEYLTGVRVGVCIPVLYEQMDHRGPQPVAQSLVRSRSSIRLCTSNPLRSCAVKMLKAGGRHELRVWVSQSTDIAEGGGGDCWRCMRLVKRDASLTPSLSAPFEGRCGLSMQELIYDSLWNIRINKHAM